jgi:hypothetical protein
MYPCEFKADSGKQSGVATFWVDGECFNFQFEKFEDCQAVCKMLDKAEQQGRRDVADIITGTFAAAIKDAFDRVRR